MGFRTGAYAKIWEVNSHERHEHKGSVVGQQKEQADQ